MKTFISAIVMLLISCIGHAADENLPYQKEYEPPGGKGRVVILISGASGTPNYTGLARDIAEQGYYAVLIDSNEFWPKDGSPADDYIQKFELLKKVILRAQQSPHALPGKVGVIAFSKGGGPALTFAARMPDLVSAVAAFYPMTYFIKDPNDFVARIQVPTLLMAGVRDTYKNCCVIGKARDLAAAVSQGRSQLEVVEYDAAHNWNLRGSAWHSETATESFRRTLQHLRQYQDK